MTGNAAGGPAPRRLFVYSGGFLTETRIRRILALSGWEVRVGLPGPDDAVGVWGQSDTARRGERAARRAGVPLVRVEDAFLRSLFPGRVGEPAHGLLIDETGVHFDAARPSDLETLLATHPLDDPALLARAKAVATSMARAHLSKFAATRPDLPVPKPGFVLIIDQTRGDASVRASGADAATYRLMLDIARAEHPGRRIVIKSHPETARGLRRGHFQGIGDDVTVLSDPVSPWHLFEAARAVYTVSSGLGFEAILAGHRPVVFGTPFYAGWGLSDDRLPLPRRRRKLSADQLAAAALILAPAWYDPFHDRLCEVEDVVATLTASARAWRDDRMGWRAHEMSRWKRPHLRAFFGKHGGVTFSGPAGTRRNMTWASRDTAEDTAVRVEDGFLRSRGLGARLTPPLSLVLDDLGIYYDPARESRLERLIADSVNVPPAEIERARRLMTRIRDGGLSKYNIGAPPPDLPGRAPRILVVGQVEDDASVLTGAGVVDTNAALIALARRENPRATLIYKPHPDVEAGLRRGDAGALPEGVHMIGGVDPHALIGLVEEVWTMTSLLGFEALLRGWPVTVTGVPFYAGWGLTHDLGATPARRTARPTLEGLVHAALIDYPRYRDPVTGAACPVEVAVDRLAEGTTPGPSGALAWLQKQRAQSER